MTEEKLAQFVITWLNAQDWDVYQEVKPFDWSPIADIVAVKAPLVWIIEVKTSFGLAVMAQAAYWRYYAEFVSIACKSSHRTSRGSQLGEEICQDKGIGVMRVDEYGICTVRVDPSLHRNRQSKKIIACLEKEHKTYAQAGNADGRHWSPFQRTCDRLRQMLKAEGPLPIKDVMTSLEHHYSSDASARTSLVQWIRAGKVPGVAINAESRPMTIHLLDKGTADND